jgi:hypothetical protein
LISTFAVAFVLRGECGCDPKLVERVRNGSFDRISVLTLREPMTHAIDA